MPLSRVCADGGTARARDRECAEMSEKQGEYSAETKKRKMPTKQRVFIDRYLVHFNASRAATEAGYSEKTAYSIGQELLNKPEILQEIEARLKEYHMSADEALKLLAIQARGDIGDLLDVTSLGFSLDMQKAKDAGLTRLIKKVKQRVVTHIAKSESDEDREVVDLEIELYDSQSAIDKILRVAGRYKDSSTVLNIDMTTLTTSQLERLAKGEDAYTVLATPGES